MNVAAGYDELAQAHARKRTGLFVHEGMTVVVPWAVPVLQSSLDLGDGIAATLRVPLLPLDGSEESRARFARALGALHVRVSMLACAERGYRAITQPQKEQTP